MLTDAKVIWKFLSLCKGNWHRCCYVRCHKCRYTDTCEVPDFLFLTDCLGYPVILPIQDAQLLFGATPDPEECLLEMDILQFFLLFDSYLASLKAPSNLCPAVFIQKCCADAMYDW